MTRLAGFAAGAVAAAVLSGCTASLHIGEPPTDAPQCLQAYHGEPDHLDGPLVLSAQSVPSASMVPCLRRLPAGWTVRDFHAQHGGSRIRLDLGNANHNAVTVTLTRGCAVGAAARASPTDEPGTRRYEQSTPDATGYRGTRYYTFLGGCVTHRFDVRGAHAAAAVATISRALSFVDRGTLREYIHDYSHGRFELDPPRQK